MCCVNCHFLKVQFYYFAKCPASACGNGENPPRGHCLFGGCSCYLPWAGPNCDLELVPPVVSPVELVQSAEEGDLYTLSLSLTQVI